ncbi:hypothetical protein [Microcoleus sp. D2_18a_D3]|uniref:hypothetical protein n=1 Tax=Microcoleus sp. D2_18a_D3 TaxID=3055330 RepID=UPI002FD568E7
MCIENTVKCQTCDQLNTLFPALFQAIERRERMFVDGLIQPEEEELRRQIGVLIKDLLIIDKQGNRNNREFIGQVSLMFAQISVELLKMSLMQGESNESINENLSENISLLLKEVLC